MQIIANAPQTVTSNSAILFLDTIISGNNCIIHREDSSLVTLKGMTNQCRARYRVSFDGNIALPSTGTARAISLAIAIDGEAVPCSTMIYTPAAVSNYGNVSASVFIDVPKNCCSKISVKNISDQSILVQNATLIIERVA